ncbi:hypothetical protein V1477_008063 [Vespula maculifrons]|uniref:Uncharacterized protein n=1 Tax=Vespula maculifrons TaxID=7453 RepID=A0ABD2CFH8_VESMC
MYWHRGAITDKTMPHNKSKITLIHKRKKIIQLIKIVIANTVYLQQKQYLQHHRQEEPDTPRRRRKDGNITTSRIITTDDFFTSLLHASKLLAKRITLALYAEINKLFYK